MDVRQVYATLNEDYDEVVSRLLTDERIAKYLHKFVDVDGLEPIYDQLAAKDWAEAFRTIHSLKGMAMNMGMSKVANSASVLCEELRSGEEPANPIEDMLQQVRTDYDEAKEVISELDI